MAGLVFAAPLPCAFTYGGHRYVNPEAEVKCVAEESPHRVRTVYEWTSPDGRLRIRSMEVAYRQFDAKEHWPELVCAGSDPTEIVEDFKSFSFVRAATNTVLRALRGTTNTANDFTPVTVAFGPGAASNEFSMAETEGRSSAQWMPWMGLDFPEGDGIEVALGWCGAWRADCMWRAGSFGMDAGLLKTRFRLLPGERLIQPAILVFDRPRDMTPLMMQTQIHRFMRIEKLPRDSSGKRFPPILPIGSGGGNKPPAMMFRIIDWAKSNAMPFDCFWVDAGWNGPPHLPDMVSNCGNMWWHFAGDWTFNPTVHPDGNLAKVADAAHAAGMKMLLWCAPEWCATGDPKPPLFLEHRDWLLPVDGPKKRDRNRLSVNLGNPEACDWVIETVSRLIRENKLDVYRQDFNIDPLPIWQEHDAPDRQGVTESKYVEGFYRFWDTIRARFPDVLIENCSGGARRMDFRTASYSHSYCRTDYALYHRGPGQITAMQNATVNSLPYQPFQGSETTPADFFDDYGFFSSVCAGSVFTPSDWNAGIVQNDFTPEQTAWLKKVFTVAARMRLFFMGDFYPLTDAREPVKVERWYRGDPEERRWCAYQMHRSDLDAGFVLCFRRLDTPGHVFAAALGGIDPDAEYETETYGGGRERMSGARLAAFRAELPRPRDFRLVFYRNAASDKNVKETGK